jgi:acetyltransferase-like isoleucine patch superfamily enzyme
MAITIRQAENRMFASKQILAGGLWPIARLVNRFGDDWRRLWAFARLRAYLPATDRSVVVLGMPELHGSRAITLGQRLYLYPGIYLETQAAGQINIGDDVVMSRGVHVVAFEGISIGAGSMIGEYASLRDANHRFGAAQDLRHSGHAAAPIKLGRNVWIGRGATVLAGVEIGDGAVVAANAVVTRSVPAGSVVGGVPARIIRSGGV